LRGGRATAIIEHALDHLTISTMLMRRFFLAFALASLAACDLSTEVADDPTDPATETFASSLQVNISTMTKTESGSYYRDLIAGTGDAISGLPNVNISYQTFLKNGTLVSTNAGNALLGQLIPGLREGMQGMRPGGERLIVIPSAQGYGNATTVPGIPPNSTLVVDMLFKGYVVQ
jgi:FKBP-type peptidyl-prolyl cis-trans isomerase FkpA